MEIAIGGVYKQTQSALMYCRSISGWGRKSRAKRPNYEHKYDESFNMTGPKPN